MLGVYLSGTGNTKHCVERLLTLTDGAANMVRAEASSAVDRIRAAYTVLLAYPTQFSNVPFMVRDFIRRHSGIWQNKRVFCMTTMGIFSGDGAGCAARELKKHRAEVIGGLHIRMPDAVCDCKMLKKTPGQNLEIIRNADRRIDEAAADIKRGVYPQDGLSVISHVAGLLGQRLWFRSKTAGYSKALKVSSACVGCGLCEKLCPMGNISVRDGRAVSAGRCAMCYRCISSCPHKALTLLGREVVEQCRFENYGYTPQI